MPTGKYIVVFKKEVTSEEISKYINEINSNGGQLGQRFDENDGIGLNGFSAAIPETFFTKFKSLQADKIEYIEADGEVSIQS